MVPPFNATELLPLSINAPPKVSVAVEEVSCRVELWSFSVASASTPTIQPLSKELLSVMVPAFKRVSVATRRMLFSCTAPPLPWYKKLTLMPPELVPVPLTV